MRPSQIGGTRKNADSTICPHLTLICHDRKVPQGISVTFFQKDHDFLVLTALAKALVSTYP
jgi:hypothetical protein